MNTFPIAPWNANTASLALDLLRSGQVVAVPTETVYGLAGVAWNSEAVTRIFAAKQRPSFDPLIAHVPPSWKSLEALAEQGVIDLSHSTLAWRQTVSQLIERFWPGPLTLLMPRHHNIVELATSGLPQVAVRMPAHPVFQELLEELQAPLAAPSANRFGRISPTHAEHVASELGDVIPLIIDGGASAVGVESTILHCDDDGLVSCLRLGAYPLEDFTEVLGYAPARVGAQHPKLAPGMLDRHYAPENLLVLLPDWQAETVEKVLHKWGGERLALLFTGPESVIPEAIATRLKAFGPTSYVLTPHGHDQEAARRLFPLLREIDAAAHPLILVETPRGEHGLWPAIRDRLQRAALPASR